MAKEDILQQNISKFSSKYSKIFLQSFSKIGLFYGTFRRGMIWNYINSGDQILLVTVILEFYQIAGV